jgi:LacI family transcriptional regulator
VAKEVVLRSTIIDVAREAGVSTATVDRVLNNRSGARSRTRELVLETAKRLGYIPNGGAFSAVVAADAGDVVRLDFALPEGDNAFIAALRAQIEQQAMMRPDLEVRVHTSEGLDPDALARTLRDLGGHSQGIGVVALDHPTVREALRALAAAKVEVVTLASDILHVPRAAYIGIDNRAAGRLAGYLVSRFLGERALGKVALVAGSLSYRGHEEREMGFRHVLAEMSAGLQMLEVREMRDDPERAYLETATFLDRHPDLVAIYNVGAGNTGVAQALKERGRERLVIFVGHEVTDGTRELLLDGTLDALIDQNPRVEAREALNVLSHRIRGLPYSSHSPRLQVIFRENIPET